MRHALGGVVLACLVTTGGSAQPPAQPPAPHPTEELRTAVRTCNGHGELFSEPMGRCLCEAACRVSVAFAPIPPGTRVSIRMPFVDVDGLDLDLDEHGRVITCGYTAVGHPVDVHVTCGAR